MKIWEWKKKNHSSQFGNGMILNNIYEREHEKAENAIHTALLIMVQTIVTEKLLKARHCAKSLETKQHDFVF